MTVETLDKIFVWFGVISLVSASFIYPLVMWLL
jgi:hypothetical protein